jgi:hypothetical protein
MKVIILTTILMFSMFASAQQSETSSDSKKPYLAACILDQYYRTFSSLAIVAELANVQSTNGLTWLERSEALFKRDATNLKLVNMSNLMQMFLLERDNERAVVLITQLFPDFAKNCK